MSQSCNVPYAPVAQEDKDVRFYCSINPLTITQAQINILKKYYRGIDFRSNASQREICKALDAKVAAAKQRYNECGPKIYAEENAKIAPHKCDFVPLR